MVSAGRRTLGLGYAIALSDLCLAPVSRPTRRGAEARVSIVKTSAALCSFPTITSRIGGYLLGRLRTDLRTSSMFLTALGAQLLAVEIPQGRAR